MPREVDLVCYWFEKAREQIEAGKAKRAGQLATQAIRGGANRRVLQRIKTSGELFFAESDREWVQEGVAVHVSMVGFDDGSEVEKILDGAPVENINPDLTGSPNLTVAKPLSENLGIAFIGDTKCGPFDVAPNLARELLAANGNPNGRPNSDVVRPWANGLDVTRRPRDYHIVDFGPQVPLEEATLYEAPFEYLNEHIRPVREQNKRKAYREQWWLQVESRPTMRHALAGLPRYLVTTRHVKHVLFTRLESTTLPDSALIAFARDDYFFGVLHSWAHELWARRIGTQLREAESSFLYTPTTCFETFPFSEPGAEQRAETSAAAKRLDELRRNWLNPEGASEAELKKRTLTNLYNAFPTWLASVHARLDAAVNAAYGWPADLPDGEVLKNLLALNLERAGGENS